MSDTGKYYYGARFVTDFGADTEYVMGDGTLSDGSGLNQTIGTDTDLTTSGATVVNDINLTDGVITAHSTRTLTLANLGYTGDANANEYVLPFTDNSSNWNTAFNWGDHSTEGYNPTVGTSTNINTSGFGVVDNISVTNGVITSMGSRSILNLSAEDTRAAEKMPEDYLDKSFSVEFTDEFDSLSSWHSGITVKGWEDTYQAWQLISGSKTTADNTLYYRQGIETSWGSMNEVWHSGSDGAGSGLDADKLDAQEGTYYLDYNNFTNTPSAYVLPTNLAGDDIDIDTGALTGATVISDLDFNITTNTSGLVTDANATVATRTLTLADLGFTGDADATNDQDLSGYLLNTTDTFTGTLSINTGVGDVGLGVYTSGESTVPNVRFGRNNTEYIGFQVKDRRNIVVFSQDETTGDHETIFDIWSSTSGDRSFTFKASNNDGTSPSSWVTIKEGNVGIGLTDPSSELEVNGEVKATTFVKSGGTAGQYLMADGSISTGDNAGVTSLVEDTTDGYEGIKITNGGTATVTVGLELNDIDENVNPTGLHIVGVDSDDKNVKVGKSQLFAYDQWIEYIEGDGSTTSFTAEHSLGLDTIIQVVDVYASSPNYRETVYPKVVRTSGTVATVTFNTAPSATAEYLVYIQKINTRIV